MNLDSSGLSSLSPDRRTLVELAVEAAARAYSPYSGFRVGAAVRLASGSTFAAGNVENASYPVGLCAERNAAGAALASGEHELVLLAVAPGDPHVPSLSPCGMCLQFLAEFGLDLRLLFKERGLWVERSLADLLPAAFNLAQPGRVEVSALHGSGAVIGGHVTWARPAEGSLFELRRLTRPDPALLVLLEHHDREAFGPAGLSRYDLATVAEAGALFVATVDGELVGSAQLLRTLPDPQALWLCGISVRPERRGRGLARLMLRGLTAALPELAARRVMLTVSGANTPALALYTGAGFRRVESVSDFYGPGEGREIWRLDAGEGR